MDLQNGLYKTFLDLVDILFEGEITQSIFEECARYIFGDKAHIIFTIDKLMTLMIKHVSSINRHALLTGINVELHRCITY